MEPDAQNDILAGLDEAELDRAYLARRSVETASIFILFSLVTLPYSWALVGFLLAILVDLSGIGAYTIELRI